MHHDLKKHAVTFAPQYGEHGFTDHLPMALVALRKLGAEEDRVEAFAKKYVKKLKRKKMPSKTIDAAILTARMGDESVYSEAFNFFVSALRQDGRAQVLRRYLPELTPAIGSAAFHGVIRTAFGLIDNNHVEIAAGLAYWWAHARPVMASPSIGAASEHVDSLADDLRSALKKAKPPLKLDQPTISARVDEIVSHPQIARILSRAANANHSFEEIAAFALQIYFARPDFSGLHCVTGVHAARILSEHVVMDDAELRSSLFTAVCAVYTAMGAPEIESLTPAPTFNTDWNVITAAAIGSDDDHDIKFAYACRDEAQRYGRDVQYRRASARQLGIR